MGLSSSSAKSDAAESKAFRINLFPDNNSFAKNESSKGDEEEGSNFIMIDIDGAADSKTMERYMQDLDLKDADCGQNAAGSKHNQDEDDDDLLALMDSCK